MQKQVPTIGKLLAIVGFTLSCFGLLLYIWVSFGGPVPFQAQGYRFTADFPEATRLAKEADVRISGVSVGKVKKTELGVNGKTVVTIQIDDKYAPRPIDTKAILRQKTLLGETYVELTPGTNGKAAIKDGGKLSVAQIAPAVELDEIFQALDPKTRAAYQRWVEEQALGLSERGQDISDALGNAGPLIEDSNELLALLNSQQGAVNRLVADGGTLFEAVGERDAQLQSMIRNLNTVFATTADRDQQLKEALIALPTFERESRKTVTRLTKFLRTTDPLVDQLHPVAKQLDPTMEAAAAVSPDLNSLITNLGAFIKYSKRGLPALDKTLDDLRPTLARLDPFLRNLNPMLEYLGLYKQEITAFLANATAATQAKVAPFSGATPLHYLRTTNPLGIEALSAFKNRLGTNRSNPYMAPGGYSKLDAGGLESFETRNCGTGNGTPSLSSTTNGAINSELLEYVQRYILDMGDQAPPCTKQDMFSFGGVTTQYPEIKQISR